MFYFYKESFIGVDVMAQLANPLPNVTGISFLGTSSAQLLHFLIQLAPAYSLGKQWRMAQSLTPCTHVGAPCSWFLAPGSWLQVGSALAIAA